MPKKPPLLSTGQLRAHEYLRELAGKEDAVRCCTDGIPLDLPPRDLKPTDRSEGTFIPFYSCVDYLTWPTWRMQEAVLLVHGFPPELADLLDVETEDVPIQTNNGKPIFFGGPRALYARAIDAAVVGEFDAVCSSGSWVVRPRAFVDWYRRPMPTASFTTNNQVINYPQHSIPVTLMNALEATQERAGGEAKSLKRPDLEKALQKKGIKRSTSQNIVKEAIDKRVIPEAKSFCEADLNKLLEWVTDRGVRGYDPIDRGCY